MFLPYDIILLLILSPFLLVIWIVAKIVKVLVKLIIKMVMFALGLSFRLLCSGFRRLGRQF